MHKEHKVTLRVYVTPDERDTLKQIAEEQNSSLSELIATAARKQYKLAKRIKVRQCTASLSNDTVVNDERPRETPPEVSSSVSLNVGTDDMTLEDEKQPLDILSSSATVPTVADVPEQVIDEQSVDSDIQPSFNVDELLSRDCEPWEFSDAEKEFCRCRAKEIAAIIQDAIDTGNNLPYDEYTKLKETKKSLNRIAYAKRPE